MTLVTGRGGAGSWQVRGEQIGAALGASVIPNATVKQIKAADVALVVKRVPDDLLHGLRRADRPWLYDIVDAYPQPLCSDWTKKQAVAWVRAHIRRLQPTAVIWPNARMRDDCELPGEVVYHHHRPRIQANPIREHFGVIGYEGRAAYLDGWHKTIERECQARGLTFLLNPARLADVDAILAVRGGEWRGYVSDHWKSNVKLANAHGSGTPFIGIPEDGYLETACGAEEWVDLPDELAAALDRLTPVATRMDAFERSSVRAFGVEKAAEQVGGILCALRS